MDGSTYQALALRTVNPEKNKVFTDKITNGAMGLCGEAGEFCDLVKKFMFQGHELDKTHAAKELGDILWYVAICCDALDTNMDNVMEMNINKLKERYPDGFTTNDSEHRAVGDE